MTGEAGRVVRRRLERALLQPEAFAQVFGRLGRVLRLTLALPLIGLVEDHAAPRGALRVALLRFRDGWTEGGGDEAAAARRFMSRRSDTSDDFEVLVVREAYLKVGSEIARTLRAVERLGRVGEVDARLVARRDGDVADRADARLRALAREELFAMAGQARCVLGLSRHVGEGRVRLARLLPVGRGELVALVAGQLMLAPAVRELLSGGCLRRAALRPRAPLRVCARPRKQRERQ